MGRKRLLQINIRAIYTRKNKTTRINGTLRRDLAKTRLIEEQVLGAVLR